MAIPQIRISRVKDNSVSHVRSYASEDDYYRQMGIRQDNRADYLAELFTPFLI